MTAVLTLIHVVINLVIWVLIINAILSWSAALIFLLWC
jgi:hypothetical protein